MKKILLIEDDKLLVRVYKARLAKLGYNIIILENGEKALETTKQIKPDIVITDIVMPYKDGFDVIKDLKNNPKTRHIPIIALTMLSQEEDRNKLISLGVTRYLAKSKASFADVVQEIDNILS